MYKFETHAHTSEISGCGRLSAAQVLDLYKEKGFDGIVITDHYTENFFSGIKEQPWEEQIHAFLKGYYSALERGRAVGITVLPGTELRLKGCANEYLLYGMDIEKFIKLPHMYEYSIEQLREVTKKHDITLFQAHPFRKNMIPISPELIDGVEVYNANLNHNSNNDKAEDYAVKNALLKLSGSDCHQAGEAGLGGHELTKRITTTRELMDEIISGNAKMIKEGKTHMRQLKELSFAKTPRQASPATPPQRGIHEDFP